MADREFWAGRRVFVTGHTGFKGSWLSTWLTQLGADVHGFALAPETSPAMFDACGLEARIATHTIGDIRDAEALTSALTAAAPEIVLHLAAQPLVRASYEQPTLTYETNVMGTLHLLEAVRKCPIVKSVVNVTTDKCYENREWLWPYREDEALGGHDPYSSSKACAELLTASYRRSFFESSGVGVGTVRAGNVVGGGDWSADRLVPDFIRATQSGRELTLRFPQAIRPWQHVLEPISGYLTLAEALHRDPARFAQAWNFGPSEEGARTVGWVVETLSRLSGGAAWRVESQGEPHEAGLLRLDSSRARNLLNWTPRWSTEEALRRSLDWYRAAAIEEDMFTFTAAQIEAYQATGSS